MYKGTKMHKKTWRGKIKNVEPSWKQRFHGIIPTEKDRQIMKAEKLERDKFNQFAHRFNPTPRLVKP